MRVIIAGALLCALASTAFAAQHYVEIWNPPEARMGDARASKGHGHKDKVSKRRIPSADRLSPRRVAEPAPRAPAAVVPTKPAPDRTPEIPPKIGPDGNVMQVSYDVTMHRSNNAGSR